MSGRVDVLGRPTRWATPEDRFWAQVSKTPDCWHWTGSTNAYGYGYLGVGARSVLVHRFAHELLIGAIPLGYEVDHLCHNADEACPGGPGCLHRRCANPSHLEAVSNRVHQSRQRKAQKTKCVNGHSFTSANTYIQPNGCRKCRACRRDSMRRSRAA